MSYMSFISLMNKTYADQFIPRILSTNLMVAHIIMIIAADHCMCTKYPDIGFCVAPYVSTMVIQYPMYIAIHFICEVH